MSTEERDANGGLTNLSVEIKADAIYRKLEKKLQRADTFDAEDLIALELLNLEAKETAKKMHDAGKNQSGYKVLEISPLSELLKEDDAPLEWRILGLMQKGHNVTLAARYKVGKTTFVTNLLKSLVDGDPFLGEFPVMQVQRPVVVFNHELSDRQFTMWLRKSGIRNTHMIIPVNLRGQGLYLQDEEAQEWAIELLRKYKAEVWIIDPLQAALRGTVNDDQVASDWIAATDRVKAESGVSELLLVTHTGHLSKADEYGRSGNERSAGSARWAGWPDALWSYTKDDEGTRYLSAEGRDIEVPEFGLHYDEKSMSLRSKGEDTGRVNAKVNGPYLKIRGYFAENQTVAVSRPELASALRLNNKDLTTGIRDAEESFLIEKCDAPKIEGKRGRTPDYYRLTGEGKYLVDNLRT